MLNKYTYQFVDAQIEEHFQSHMWVKAGRPIYNLISGSFIISLIIEIGFNSILLNIQGLVIGVSLLAMSAFLLYLVYIRPEYVGIILALSFLLILFNQLSVNQGSDPMYTHMLGANTTILLLLILYISDFKWAVLCNLSLMIVKIGISTPSFTQEYVKQYVAAILMFILIFFATCIQNKNTRLQYYLGLKDSQWERMIPSLIQTPFVVFTYNNEQLKFDLKMTNIQESGPILQSLLRNLLYQGFTLEQYLFNKIQRNQCSDCKEQLQVEINKRNIQISYSEFYLTDHTFLIVLPGEAETKIRNEYSKMFKKQIQGLTRFIGNVQQSIQLSVRQRSIHKMIRINSFLFEYKMQQLYQFGKAQHPKQINLVSLFNEISLVTWIQFKIDTNNHQFIYGIKHIWSLFILQLLKYRIEQKSIQIYIESNDKLYIICKFDSDKLEDDEMFINLRQMLLTDFLRLTYGYLFNLADQPLIPYKSYQHSQNIYNR